MSKPRNFAMIDDFDDYHLRWNKNFRERQIPVTAFHFLHGNGGGPRHDHEYFEIQLCAGGKGWQESSLGDRPFRRGNVLVIHPGAWHRHHDNVELESYMCGFLDELLHHELLWTLDDPRLNRMLWRASSFNDNGVVAIHLTPSTLKSCIEHFDALAAIGESGDPETIRDRLGHLILILSCLARGMDGPVQGDEGDENGFVHAAVKRSVALVNESLAESWTTVMLARRVNIDASYLGRLFQSALGVSPVQYIAQARAKRAARLLLRTAMPITEIAVEVGWPDANYFARRFRACFGVSASEYRRRHAGSADRAGARQPGTSQPVASSELLHSKNYI